MSQTWLLDLWTENDISTTFLTHVPDLKYLATTSSIYASLDYRAKSINNLFRVERCISKHVIIKTELRIGIVEVTKVY